MAGTMTNEDRREWTYFFQQLERFIIDLQRHHGIASERYKEYAIEKLALVHSSSYSYKKYMTLWNGN